MVRRDVDGARSRAREIAQTAQAEASEKILQEAEQKRAEVREDARQEGYEEGLRHWNEILAAAAGRSDELLRRNEADLVRLAVRMAEKIEGSA